MSASEKEGTSTMPYEPKTIGELLDWSYANLAAYQVALKEDGYGRDAFAVRSRLFKGLRDGTMSRRSIYEDEHAKLADAGRCAYCGGGGPLTLDHLFPRSAGGSDSGDNLVYACRSCNSSKGDRDYFAWCASTDRAVSPAVATRYLKNAYAICSGAGLLDTPVGEAPDGLPFDLGSIPTVFDLPRR